MHNDQDNMLMPDLSISTIKVAFRFCTDKWERNNVSPREWFGLVYVTHGSIQFNFPDGPIVTQPGDIIIYPKGIPYDGKRLTKEDNGSYVINFDTDMQEFQKLGLPLCFHPTHGTFIRNKFDELTTLWNDDHTFSSRLRCHSLFLELLAIITESYYAERAPVINQSARNAITYIEQHFNDPALRIDTLCEMFSISPSHLRRSIWQYRHMAPMDFLHQMRINHAKSLLLNTSLQIQNIAEECGFNNIHYFSRLFTTTIGISPTEYRRIHTR